MGISRIGQAHGMDYISAMNNRKKTISQSRFPSLSGDTVSISSETMAMYLVSKSDSQSSDKELKNTLAEWFNSLFGVSGGGDCIPTGVSEQERSSWPSENIALCKQFEAEVETVDTEKHTVFKSKELREKLETLTQKFNVLAALGNKMVVTDGIMEQLLVTLDKLYADWKDKKGWIDSDGLSSVGEELSRKGHSSSTSKSVLSMLMESLFVAELEESGALGGSRAETDGNERQTGDNETSRPQPNSTTSASSLEDGDTVAQVKKVLTDFTQGKADLTDVSTAMGGGKSIGQVGGGSTVTKSNESKKPKVA